MNQTEALTSKQKWLIEACLNNAIYWLDGFSTSFISVKVCHKQAVIAIDRALEVLKHKD